MEIKIYDEALKLVESGSVKANRESDSDQIVARFTT